MFVNLDEATLGGYKQANQILKNFITEPKAMLTEKSKGSIRINSYVNLAVANNHDYWAPLLPLFYEKVPKTRDIFYKYLLSRDLTDFNMRIFPQTQARAAIMVGNRDNIIFQQHLAMHPDADFSNANEAMFMSSERLYELYKMYKMFVGDGGVFGKQTNKIAFAKHMVKLLPRSEKRTNKEHGFVVPKSVDLEAMMRAAKQWSNDQF